MRIVIGFLTVKELEIYLDPFFVTFRSGKDEIRKKYGGFCSMKFKIMPEIRFF